MNRTSEFIATINARREKPQFVQRRGVDRPVSIQNKEFMRICKDCAHRLRDCYAKLESFTVLAKTRTVFDDQELARLVEDISSDISVSKAQLDELHRLKPKPAHFGDPVSTLEQRLASVASTFKTSLENRSRKLQEQSARLEMFAGPTVAVPESQEQQLLLMPERTDLSERADAMHSIESTIIELGTVFNQLAHMVQAQGETITRIDMNISETTGNVEAAHEALLGYFASINSNRWLILKVFMVLFFFFIMFVIFGT